MKKKKIYVTWEDINEGVKDLINLLYPDKSKYDSVYGIPRGGVVLAFLLSYHLDLPLVDKPSEHTLIVDDISDTGYTLKEFESTHDIVTLFSTEWTKTKPKYYIFEKFSKNHWLIFAWEDLNCTNLKRAERGLINI